MQKLSALRKINAMEGTFEGRQENFINFVIVGFSILFTILFVFD